MTETEVIFSLKKLLRKKQHFELFLTTGLITPMYTYSQTAGQAVVDRNYTWQIVQWFNSL